MYMTHVDSTENNFFSTMQGIIAQNLGTAQNCVVVSTVSRSASNDVSVESTAGVRREMSPSTVEQILMDPAVQGSVCRAFATSNACAIVGVTADGASSTTTTSTTEMPWGLPWWAWFLIICGGLFLCCAIPAAAVPMSGGSKGNATGGTDSRTPQYADPNQQYEVVEMGGSNMNSMSPYAYTSTTAINDGSSMHSPPPPPNMYPSQQAPPPYNSYY
eukprot:CAMPEP_0178408102 /NCGR_PEP_ID=MMETSP0689_2-20121128/19767_1 /TAXON_ID=160604 /ORGANISM="Amphidinium massartii, Strain CS-259" /LENGTH=215 /DNA_ID=CAMNT_0020029189 /DNA_START=243 /DNA_END=890 /DNA_ORIENTATION=+